MSGIHFHYVGRVEVISPVASVNQDVSQHLSLATDSHFIGDTVFLL